MDIVERLRTAADRADQVFDTTLADPWREAADEIERLRARLMDAELSLGAYDPGGSSEYWLRHREPAPDRPELSELIAKSVAWLRSLTPEQQEAHLREQRESWVRGEMGIGLDKDEAEWRDAAEREKASHVEARG